MPATSTSLSSANSSAMPGFASCIRSAARRSTVVVDDVHAFPGHIPCDAAANSEIVVPLLNGPRLLGVLDLDSPQFGRFSERDAAGLEEVGRRLARGCDWSLAGID